MNRREVVLGPLALGAAALPLQVLAQARNGGKPYRIALLPDLTAVGLPVALKVFTDTLSEAGRVEGRDFTFIHNGIRFGSDPGTAIERMAKSVVDEMPDVILAGNTRHIVAVHRLTRSIPIVMWEGGFPVEAGLADSLARPGRNVTGISGYAGTGVLGKYLQLLSESKPGIKRIGVLWVHVPPGYLREEIEPQQAEIRNAARQLGLDVRILEMASAEQVDAGLAAVSAERIEALVIQFGALMGSQGKKVMDLVIQKRLPTLTDYRWGPTFDLQPLLAYGPLVRDLMRQAAGYVDRMLWGGAKAGDLPIQQPTRIELMVNLRMAKMIGLTIPQSLLLRADEVMQ